MTWSKQKQVCYHCAVNNTKREFEGNPSCGDCKIKILMDREMVYMCPVDHVQMTKEHQEEIIIDRCPKCNGVWLDSGELDAIKEAVGDSSFIDGLAAGLTSG